MNRLSFLIEPGDDQIGYAAALIVKLLSDGAPGSRRPAILDVRTTSAGHIKIVAEYPQKPASAPLQPINKHPLALRRRHFRPPRGPDRRN